MLFINCLQKKFCLWIEREVFVWLLCTTYTKGYTCGELKKITSHVETEVLRMGRISKQMAKNQGLPSFPLLYILAPFWGSPVNCWPVKQLVINGHPRRGDKGKKKSGKNCLALLFLDHQCTGEGDGKLSYGYLMSLPLATILELGNMNGTNQKSIQNY